MKIIKFISVLTVLSLTNLARAEVMSQQQVNMLFDDLTASPTVLVEQFGNYTIEDNLALFLTTATQLRPGELTDILTQIFANYPQHTSLIAQIARSLEMTSQDITIAAIEAGIDPTVIADATAAGIQSVVAAPTPNVPTKKDPISAN